MFLTTLFFLAFCLVIGYTKASIETIFGIVTVIGVGALVLGFLVNLRW